MTGSVPHERFTNLVTAIGAGINGIERVDVAGPQVAARAAAPATAAPTKGGANAAKGGTDAEANVLADPDRIRVGQTLKIPGTTHGPEAVLG